MKCIRCSCCIYIFFKITQMAYHVLVSCCFLVLGSQDIALIQISFDGNNSDSPPNLMEGNIFKRLKNEVALNLVSCIDIIYTGDFYFEDCSINRRAAKYCQKERLLYEDF